MKPRRHVEAAYKSGLEAKFQEQTKALGYDLPYEIDRIKYTIPASKHTYTPDFTIKENVYVETKGLWTGTDRKKAMLIKEQHPQIHILYVFYRDQKLSKKSLTTYLAWANKNGLEACTFADKPTWIDYIKRHI